MAYRFQPPQPVLSQRSVQDIDLSGTRTYRAVSADDIIEEQHRLIHAAYSDARLVMVESLRASCQQISGYRQLKF